MKAKYIVGLVIILAFVAWGASSFMTTTIRYVSFEEVPTSSGTVQVLGTIDFDRVQFNNEQSRLEFEITDPDDSSHSKRLKVIYGGVVPGNFEQATQVVVKGHYENNVFWADKMYVKCPSKYQGLENEA
jgi:cytochrome c-type biogenesis protein CcmE